MVPRELNYEDVNSIELPHNNGVDASLSNSFSPCYLAL
jgi:hypothetical protein